MEGMETGEFDRRLRRCGSHLHIDRYRIAYPYSKEYPTCGVYNGDKFIMGIPQKYQPKNTVGAINFKRLEKDGRLAEIKQIQKIGFIPQGSDIEERILWRGYLAILQHLVKIDILNREKVEKVFNIKIEPKRQEFPRNYIHMDF